jgi:SAM-dependent methyltransferase
MSPSKALGRFANQIAFFDKGPVVDAPCGYGHNAVALAAQGCTVIAIDIDRKRLAALDQVKVAYIAGHASRGVRTGQIFTVCADLTAEGWPIAPSSVSAIVCVHFAIIGLLPRIIPSLQVGGYLYVETFGGQGENFRELPKAGELRELLSGYVEFGYYKERKVGPPDLNRVAVTLFARRRAECDP